MTETLPQETRPYPNISSKAYEHPADHAATAALFPASGQPGWLAVLNRLDPLTYAVDPMRRLAFSP